MRFFVAPAASPPLLLRMTVLSDKLLDYTIQGLSLRENSLSTWAAAPLA